MKNPIKAMLRASGNNSTFEVTIPKSIVDYEGFKDGDKLLIIIVGKAPEDQNEAADNATAN